MINISVCIITKHSQNTLKDCLDSLKDFDEMILIDNGSSDETLAIARGYANVRVQESEFIGFGPLKNIAISYANID